MPSNHFILCRPLLLPPSIFPSIRVFSNESVLCIRWSKYWSFSISISPSNKYSGLISLGWTGWITMLSKGLSRVFSNTTVQKESVQYSSVTQSCPTPWTVACQASLSNTNSQSLLKLMSIKMVMLSNHLILCRPLLLPPSIFPSIRVFSKKSVLCIRWLNYWSFSFSISPSNEYSGLISLGWTGWISLPSKRLSRVFSKTTVQKH